jgi:hypothetical protein
MSVPALSVSEELVALETAAEIVIEPDVSISALLVANIVTRSEFRIFAVPEVFA